MNIELGRLKGLGPQSEKWLNSIGIYTKADLVAIGPVKAFLELRKSGPVKPSLNLLYAMVGALEDVHWTKIAKADRIRLLMELEDYAELEKFLNSDQG